MFLHVRVTCELERFVGIEFLPCVRNVANTILSEKVMIPIGGHKRVIVISFP